MSTLSRVAHFKGASVNSVRPAFRAAVCVGAAAALLASVAGCGGPGKSAAPHVVPKGSAAAAGAASAPTANPTTQPSAFLPIARFSLAPADALLLQQAENILITNCMARFGFSWTAVGHVAVTPGTVQDRRYGVTAADDVAVNGYHLPADPHPPLPKVSRDEQLALVGTGAIGEPVGNTVELKGHKVPLGGCQQEAQRTVDGDPTPLPGSGVASDISAESFETSMKDPAVRQVIAAWSACMKAKGFSYPDPMNAGADFTAATVSAKEKKVAVADVACKQRTNLVPVWFAAESRVQRTMIAPQTAVLAAVLTRHQQQVARATSIIAKG